MTKKTSRRGLITGGAASIAALSGLGATSSLLGRKEKETMQTQTETQATALRGVERILQPGSPHWVGDGFLVHGMLSPSGEPRLQSPFLLLDHASRRRFEPSAQRRGVGEHPHRGFETVTLAYAGEIEHRDSSGGGGIIGPGDVQWMTAAGGVVHEEMHSLRFSEEGGDMEMVQLWVNLPAHAKLSKPTYQGLLDKQFPRLALGAAEARLIAGELAGARGPARTHTPLTLFDLRFTQTGASELTLPRGHTVLIFPLEGEVELGAKDELVLPGALAFMKRDEHGPVRVSATQGARVLVLSGEPIDEPVAAYGPFVMNTRDEIVQAMRDYQSGKMGHLR
jgi:redox-sensitive bicupin YhaK (pirin superfamily)